MSAPTMLQKSAKDGQEALSRDGGGPVLIKLRGLSSTSSGPLSLFVRDFEQGTQAHPVSGHLRLWKGCILLEVKPTWGAIRLSSIQSIEKRQGRASQALEWLTELSSRHGVRIEGDVAPQGEGGLTKPQLNAWYARHGFSVGDDGRLTFFPNRQCLVDTSQDIRSSRAGRALALIERVEVYSQPSATSIKGA